MSAPSNIIISGFAHADGKFYSSDQAPATGTLIASANFTDGQLVPQNIYAGANWSQFTSATSGFTTSIVGGKIKFHYPVTNGDGSGLDLGIGTLGLTEFYLTFKASMPNAKNGMKFLKIFGTRTGTGGDTYANTTFGLDYTGVPDGIGTMYYISYGDGTSVGNDTANGIWLDGSNNAGAGRSYPGTAVISTPQMKNFRAVDWSTTEHTFKIHVKFNSGTTAGNEVADGAYYLEIDGLVYANATGLFNRHYLNQPIDYIEFAGYSQGNGPACDVLYDDIRFGIGGYA